MSNKNIYTMRWLKYYKFAYISLFSADLFLAIFFTILCITNKSFALEIGIYIFIFVVVLFSFGAIICLIKYKRIKKDLRD